MAVFRCGLALLVCSPFLLAAPARADDAGTCRVIDVDFTVGGIQAGKRRLPGAVPKDDDFAFFEAVPQIVAWIEKPSGEYVQTIYITQQTGRYGIGNRPGRFDFNSGPRWPYGRRVMVFPVWSHKHGLAFPQVAYRNADDNNLSHPYNESSPEVHFCKPLQSSDALWDATTCSSVVYTDKGVFSPQVSGYPPRSDLASMSAMDSPSVAMYKTINQFDAVSQATPRLGSAAQISWPIPPEIPQGQYVLVMEVALEEDFNLTYLPKTYPSPPKSEIPYSDYGVPYRGQPSVIYKVAFTVSDVETIATTETYAGYGDPNGLDGKIRPDDDTITKDVPNSGAARLLLTSSGDKMFRVRVDARPEQDFTAPSTPADMVVSDAGARDATLRFTAPGDDGMLGTVRGYEVRYVVGDGPITEASFNDANDAKFDAEVAQAGHSQQVTIKDLLPETDYTVAIRAFDDCHNVSPLAITTFTTAARQSGEVDACFIATAAYGSVMANDVEMLRRFRDLLLKRSVLGELAVETYYTFGPSVAGVVGESDLLRSTARAALAPLVDRVRQLRW